MLSSKNGTTEVKEEEALKSTEERKGAKKEPAKWLERLKMATGRKKEAKE